MIIATDSANKISVKTIATAGFLLVFALPALSAHAQEHEPQTATTPDERYITVEVGPQEAESTGSYAVRLYANGVPEFPTDDFLVGIVRPRDGQLLPIKWQDITGDGTGELIVVTETVGSGSYRTAEAFQLGKDNITLVAAAAGLAPDADMTEALKLAAK